MGKTIWGAFDESLEKEIDKVVEKLKKLGIPKPTKKEASALIAMRSNLAFMSEKDIKEFVLKMRGY